LRLSKQIQSSPPFGRLLVVVRTRFFFRKMSSPLVLDWMYSSSNRPLGGRLEWDVCLLFYLSFPMAEPNNPFTPDSPFLFSTSSPFPPQISSIQCFLRVSAWFNPFVHSSFFREAGRFPGRNRFGFPLAKTSPCRYFPLSPLVFPPFLAFGPAIPIGEMYEGPFVYFYG